MVYDHQVCIFGYDYVLPWSYFSFYAIDNDLVDLFLFNFFFFFGNKQITFVRLNLIIVQRLHLRFTMA